MSLIRLLTTGRSLVNIPDGDSRYRVTSQRLLPHFGARQNPFSCGDKAEPVQTAPCSSGDHTPKVEPTPARAIPASSAEQAAVPQSKLESWSALAKSKLQGLIVVARRSAAGLLVGCKAKLAALSARRRSKAAKPAIPRFSKAPVQTELSLDQIKVLRNDLSDADLEVIPAKPPSASAMRAVERAAGAENVWGRVTARFLGTGKT